MNTPQTDEQTVLALMNLAKSNADGVLEKFPTRPKKETFAFSVLLKYTDAKSQPQYQLFSSYNKVHGSANNQVDCAEPSALGKMEEFIKTSVVNPKTAEVVAVALFPENYPKWDVPEMTSCETCLEYMEASPYLKPDTLSITLGRNPQNMSDFLINVRPIEKVLPFKGKRSPSCFDENVTQSIGANLSDWNQNVIVEYSPNAEAVLQRRQLAGLSQLDGNRQETDRLVRKAMLAAKRAYDGHFEYTNTRYKTGAEWGQTADNTKLRYKEQQLATAAAVFVTNIPRFHPTDAEPGVFIATGIMQQAKNRSFVPADMDAVNNGIATFEHAVFFTDLVEQLEPEHIQRAIGGTGITTDAFSEFAGRLNVFTDSFQRRPALSDRDQVVRSASDLALVAYYTHPENTQNPWFTSLNYMSRRSGNYDLLIATINPKTNKIMVRAESDYWPYPYIKTWTN